MTTPTGSPKFRVVVYSHSDYQDVLAPSLARLETYNINPIILYDRISPKLPAATEYIPYNDSLTYRERVSSSLKKIDWEEYVLFMHEDFILYGQPDWKRLDVYMDMLESTPMSFVRLLKCGEIGGDPNRFWKGLHHFPEESNHIFAIQASIWKREKLIEVYEKTPGNTIWDFEENAQAYCHENNIHGMFHYNGENKRGLVHWDSNVWPYMATAVLKGKWNMSEYREELLELFSEHDIDPMVRGIV